MQTEVKLGDDLLRQINLTSGGSPDGTTDESIKFDAKGTLHVMCRNDDGKLLKDIPVKEVDYKRSYKDEVTEEYSAAQDAIAGELRLVNIVFGIFCSVTIGLIILAGYLIWRL